VAKLPQSRDVFFDLVLVSDCSRYQAENSDNFFDLATVSGVFGKYAKKSKLVVWLV
jgi:hypothetical protein